MQTFIFQASISFGQRSWVILMEEWEREEDKKEFLNKLLLKLLWDSGTQWREEIGLFTPLPPSTIGWGYFWDTTL